MDSFEQTETRMSRSQRSGVDFGRWFSSQKSGALNKILLRRFSYR